MDWSEPDIVVALVGPLLTALLAGTGLLIKEWRTRRRWEHRRDEILEQGRRRVAFISDWVVAYDNLKVPEQERTSVLARARADLDELYDTVAAQTRAAVAQRPQRRSRQDYARSLLLTGIRRPRAKVSRVVYLTVLAFALLSGVLMTTLSFSGDELPFLAELGVAVFATGLYLIPAWLLHVLTRHLDRPSPGTLVPGDVIAAVPGP
jgi:hypothetical protein